MTGGRPDQVVVRRHLAELRRAVANLQQHKDVSAMRLNEFETFARHVEVWLEGGIG